MEFSAVDVRASCELVTEDECPLLLSLRELSQHILGSLLGATQDREAVLRIPTPHGTVLLRRPNILDFESANVPTNALRALNLAALHVCTYNPFLKRACDIRDAVVFPHAPSLSIEFVGNRTIAQSALYGRVTQIPVKRPAGETALGFEVPGMEDAMGWVAEDETVHVVVSGERARDIQSAAAGLQDAFYLLLK